MWYITYFLIFFDRYNAVQSFVELLQQNDPLLFKRSKMFIFKVNIDSILIIKKKTCLDTKI